MSRVFVSMVVVLILAPLSTMGGNSLAKQVHDLVKRVDVQYALTKDLQADFI